MPRRLSVVTLLVVTALLFAMTGVTLLACRDVDLASASALKTSNTFYFLQIGQSNPAYDLVLFCMLTIFANFIFVYAKNSPFFFNIIQRIGYRRFLTKGVVVSFIGGATLSLLMSLYQLVLLSLFIHPLSFGPVADNKANGLAFYDDGNLWSTIQFCFLAAIGWGIYAMFVFSATLWVKKTAIAIVSGSLLGVAFFLAPAILAQLLNGHLSGALYSLQVSTLIAPGMVSYPTISMDKTVFYFICAACLYTLLTVSSASLWMKKKERFA
ncbi:hypothetical protein LQZ24_03250 [Fructobacillus sp. M1-13]|uniref:ABC transporter permease n=1 Tax=Fructobacillus papyriferae TaxID=2713171 RepID=A0ABS5QQ53_9LACO|nr:hypothetical protein [Fructobacillus papyriferae]MBS9335286.1 hypothetical protein [Fructobacillus papyriferae]MCD2159045.1 hypothetical protein [Fructobacillus papyriferae]